MSKKEDLAGFDRATSAFFNHIEDGGGVYDCMKFLHNININKTKEIKK